MTELWSGTVHRAVIRGLEQQVDELRAENERLREYSEQIDDQLSNIAAAIRHTIWMDPPDGGDTSLSEQVKRMRQDAERWRESQELGLVPWDTIIEAIGDWGGPEHECFNKAIGLISRAMK